MASSAEELHLSRVALGFAQAGLVPCCAKVIADWFPLPRRGISLPMRRGDDTQRLWAFQARAAPYLFVAPFVLLFCVFLLYPMGRSLFLSLHRTAGTEARQFIGLGHYRYILTDELFWLACLNTVVFAVLFLSIQIPASLGLAMLLNSRFVRFRNAFRFAFFSSHIVKNGNPDCRRLE